MTEPVNATIERTQIYKGRGVPTATLYITSQTGSAGFGGYDLRRGNSMCNWIMKCCETLGVESWEDLAGQMCRVKWTQPGSGGRIAAIGHIMEDRWFTPETDLYTDAQS